MDAHGVGRGRVEEVRVFRQLFDFNLYRRGRARVRFRVGNDRAYEVAIEEYLLVVENRPHFAFEDRPLVDRASDGSS